MNGGGVRRQRSSSFGVLKIGLSSSEERKVASRLWGDMRSGFIMRTPGAWNLMEGVLTRPVSHRRPSGRCMLGGTPIQRVHSI
jgi:hypothetical protein